MKRIVRDLHVSRNTVRKTLGSDETDFTCERGYRPMPRLGPWQSEMDRFLIANVGKPTLRQGAQADFQSQPIIPA